MKDSFKVFVDAAKETPRLYFAPLREALHAVSKMQDAMMKTQRGQTRGEFGKFETRERHDKKITK